MPDIILPSKLVPERITASFEFMDEVEWGEVIVLADVDILVFSGVDSSPQDVQYSFPSVSGTLVTQKLHKGIPGVIYSVICTATGSTGRVYQKVGRLAILPSNALAPPFFGYTLSSRPYPVDVTEKYSFGASFLSGRLSPRPFPLDLYAFGTPTFQSGTLVGSYNSYVGPADSYSFGATFQVGNLYGSAKAYTIPAESYQFAATLFSGTLVGGYVAYSTQPDKYAFMVSFISGTLG